MNPAFMKPNLFDSLFSYRPRSDRNPLEDYFTELVGFLFSFDGGLTSEWIKEIWNEVMNPKDPRIITQYSLGDYGRADLALFWTDHGINKSLLIEHKIGSPIGWRGRDELGEVRTQVDNYLSYQRERGDPKNHKVAICKVSPLTEYKSSSPYFLGGFTWGQLYKILNRIVQSRSESDDGLTTKLFLYEQTSEFMRRHKMVFENFTVQDLASIDSYNSFEAKLIKLSGIVVNRFKESTEKVTKILGYPKDATKGLAEHYGLILHNKKNCSLSSIWVHIGFLTCSEDEGWYPPIILKRQGIPDAQVMLGLWPNNIEKTKQTYGNIVDDLNKYLNKTSTTDIKFEMIESNKFLCFSFRRPISDFLRYQDQESEIINFLETGYNALSNLAKEGILSELAKDFKE